MQSHRCAPKLTDRHIAKFNECEYCCTGVQQQCCSRHESLYVSRNYWKGTAPTIEFVGLINDLFDSMNGSSINPLHGKNTTVWYKTHLHIFLFGKKILEEISSWQLVEKNVKKTFI